MKIGVISDTHGLLRPQVFDALHGCELIVHAGDIGSAEVLAGLGSLAPVTAIRGNNDKGTWARPIAETTTLHVGSIAIHVVHRLQDLQRDALPANTRVIVFGHSHQPSIATHDGVLYLNPGSAGPRRFKLPISVAELIVTKASPRARIIELDVPATKARR